MKEVLLFLNKYYNYYFFLFIFVIVIGITYYKQRADIQGVKKKVAVLLGSYIEASFLALLMKNYNIPLFNKTEHPYFYSFACEAMLAVLCGLMLVKINNCIINSLRNVKNSEILKKNKYGFVLFGIMIIHFLINIPSKVSGWASVWYAVDYTMGLGSRFFIGSLLSLFYDDFLNKEIIYVFCVVMCIILIVITAYMLNQLILSTSSTNKKGIVFLITCFIACPGSIMAMWSSLGKLELFTLIVNLLAVILFHKLKNIYVKYIVITVLSCVSMAIYQGDLFLYYPIIVMIVLYEGLVSEENSKTKKILGLVNIASTSIMFLYFQFFSYTKFTTPQEMVSAIEEKSNVSVSEEAIRYEFFEPVITAYKELNIGFLSGTEMPREKTFMTLCLLIPICFIVYSIYMKCFEYLKSNSKSLLKMPHIYFLFLNLSVVPQFALNVDWARWMNAYTIVLFFGIFYLSYREDEAMNLAIDRLSIFVEKHSYLAVITIMYLAMLDKFNGRDFVSQGSKILDMLF